MVFFLFWMLKFLQNRPIGLIIHFERILLIGFNLLSDFFFLNMRNASFSCRVILMFGFIL